MSKFDVTAIVTLRKGEGRTIKSGGAWIYDNEIAKVESKTELLDNGGIVEVHDFDDYFLGYGFINVNSKIRIRMLSRYRKEPIDAALLRQRARDAWDYRKAVIDTSSCRVIFGEADFLPGLVVDKYEDLLVFQSLSLGIDRLKDEILEELMQAMAEDGIQIRGIFERSDAPVRKKEGLPTVKAWYYLKPEGADQKDNFELGKNYALEHPDTNPHIIITENGVQYDVDVKDGQKTGFFLDQKNNRMALQGLVQRLLPSHPEELRVLDCFTHMGTFALNAGHAGATDVTGLDISEFAVEQATQNAIRNGLNQQVKFKAVDVFEELPRLQEAGEKYDIVVLDPPAFTKSKEATKKAITGYREINIRGLKLVKNGGYLCTCSCSHFMTQELFEKMMKEAARGAHRAIRQVEFRQQAADHPILANGDENSNYLKFYIYQVVEIL